MSGRFGTLTPQQTEYLLTLARAFLMAPDGSWAKGRLLEVADEEVNRYGIPQHVFWSRPETDVVAVDDTIPGAAS